MVIRVARKYAVDESQYTSNSLKLFVVFFSNHLEFLSEILVIYLSILSTLKCQVAFNNL